MTQILIIGLLSGIGWTLVAGALDAHRISPAVIMLATGIVAGLLYRPDMSELLDSSAVERGVEIILALLLFVDATEVRGGFLGHDRGAALRLLFIALPLSVGGAVILGLFLLPTNSVAVLVLIACAVMPTDLSPAGHLLRSRVLPQRVRHLLNVESGYNDGIVAPIFVFGLTLALAQDDEASLLESIGEALAATGVAVAVGLVCGAVTAVSTNAALRRGLTDNRALGMTVVMAAVLAYAAATMFHGNGFVAAFVCGLAYQATQSRRRQTAGLVLVEDIATLANIVVWLMFGVAVCYLFEIGWPGFGIPLLAIAALTVLRIVPVTLSLTRSRFNFRERLMVAAIGPRGTASIVFGLLAWTKLADSDIGDASVALYTVVTTVLFSVVAYGLTAWWLGRVEKSSPTPRSSDLE
ncbi:sodium:proton exchanger [Gordonia desulfuricans]|uniref:Sodium:proton exchanger n=1 Tax=Gordonia desulfuricans TaxID=89051 RepID=A0A7K3LIV2_9ACTN|nr:cation:proton antiporter [Gordonia desulfuricans]NDK88192.1 sodium:proton exchanger [Gordonia desulfuricans]